MKNLFKIGSILLLIAAFVIFYKTFKQASILEEDKPEEVLGEISDKKSLDVGGYRVTWFEVDGEQLTLISNFTEKKAASELILENQCKNAVNASFYSKENTPIGLFINNAEVRSGYRSNNLFNGIFSVNKLETPRITREMPKDELDIAIQSGPLIMENDQFLEYSSNTDKNARRMVAMITGENKIIFASIYNKDSVFNGPKLSELSGIISVFEERVGQNIADAINLDGGSASAFFSDRVKLTEISPVGSLFCVK